MDLLLYIRKFQIYGTLYSFTNHGNAEFVGFQRMIYASIILKSAGRTLNTR
jgi:hypothetical protein